MDTLVVGYQIREVIYESAQSLIYRGYQTDTGQPVILKILKNDYPSPELVARFKREFEITRSLDFDGIIKVYSLDQYHNSLTMVLEDFGGTALTRYGRKEPFDLAEWLTLTIKIVEIVGQLHLRHLIHKDLNPANILYNELTGQVKIIDFGISTVLSRENPAIFNPTVLEGTLAYISPEQTGRMNRALDYRTDFYSLGVTFYELLTGQLPFALTDPMALVHSHIARQPTPPHQLDPMIPLAVSEIILKLLAKTAEARYQSAQGLKTDLETCLKQLQITGQILPFTPGQQDLSDRFQIPERLYGREGELTCLLETFERISRGNAELMLVEGQAGIGKSALVNEIHKPIVRDRGFFISGKYDQFQRNIPYAAIIQALRSLIQQLLSENEEQIAAWRDQILTRLGLNCQILYEGIPELELITGPQPAVAELGSAEAQNRFKLVIRNFIGAFAGSEHPLVIFLDDLQWADLASLKLIQAIMTNPENHYLFLLGAYREETIDAGHPLKLTLAEIEQAGGAVSTLLLKPLELNDTAQLLADTLHTTLTAAEPLAELVLTKTEGNPFFINEFLKSLYQDQLLTFDHRQGRWTWDLGGIQELDITANVVELMADKLKKLPALTQTILQHAATIGNEFDLATLAIIVELSPLETAGQLWPALRAGLITPIGNAYQLLQDDPQTLSQPQNGHDKTDSAVEAALLDKVVYRFAHDRVQQAAYSLIDADQRPTVHLKIGRLLKQHLDAARLSDQSIFDIVNQLNQGANLLEETAERTELAQLNLRAGQQAKKATAYEPANAYLLAGIRLLAEDSWQTHYDLSLTLYLEAAETAYLSADFVSMESLTEVILTQAKDLLEKIKVYEIRMQANFSQLKMKETLEIGLRTLELLGITLPTSRHQLRVAVELVRVKLQLRGKTIADLRQMPPMNDPYILATTRVLMNMSVATYFIDPDLIAFLVFKMIGLTLKYGLAPVSSYGFSAYGFILSGALEDFDQAYQFSRFALELQDQFAAEEFKAKMGVILNGFIRIWKEPLQSTLGPLLEAYQSGLETGDLEFASAATVVYCYHALFMGKDLKWVEEETAKYTEVTRRLKQERYIDSNAQNWQTALNLITPGDQPGLLVGEQYNEVNTLPRLIEANDRNSICSLYLYKAMLYFLFNDYAQALTYAEYVEKDLDTLMGSFLIPVHNFYYSLAMLNNYATSTIWKRQKLLRRVAANQRRMKKWLRYAPMNYEHKHFLVEAERARISQRFTAAMDYYDRAIDLARQNGFINDEALAYELAARFYQQIGRHKIAQTYLLDARQAYLRWGATAKAKMLDEQAPQLQRGLISRTITTESSVTTTLTTVTSGTTTTTSQTAAGTLDLSTVIKASQTISGEIVLGKLLEQLMAIVIENAGAQRGFLILDKKGELVIEAEKAADQEAVRVLQSVPVAQNPTLGAAIVNYVARTHEPVVLNDATAAGQFSHTDYVIAHKPKSILCTPLLNQGRLTAILYLENNLTAGAFTPNRLEILNLLSAQAAISIENARLYTNLEELVKERTARLQTVTDRLQGELRMAQKIQRSLLLPGQPDWPDLDLRCHTTPAREVGGDFYAYHAFGDQRFAIAVGDVSGKGMPAALLMGVSIASLQAFIDQDIEPSHLLTELDRTLMPYTRSTNHNCALCYTELNGNQLRVVNAGCISPLVRHQDGSVAWVDAGGMPLGIGLGAEIGYLEATLTLEPGDMVILTSDGVVEATALSGELFGFERIEQAVARGPDTKAEAMLAHLRSEVATFVGQAEPHDDATIIVFRI